MKFEKMGLAIRRYGWSTWVPLAALWGIAITLWSLGLKSPIVLWMSRNGEITFAIFLCLLLSLSSLHSLVSLYAAAYQKLRSDSDLERDKVYKVIWRESINTLFFSLGCMGVAVLVFLYAPSNLLAFLMAGFLVILWGSFLGSFLGAGHRKMVLELIYNRSELLKASPNDQKGRAARIEKEG